MIRDPLPQHTKAGSRNEFSTPWFCTSQIEASGTFHRLLFAFEGIDNFTLAQPVDSAIAIGLVAGVRHHFSGLSFA